MDVQGQMLLAQLMIEVIGITWGGGGTNAPSRYFFYLRIILLLAPEWGESTGKGCIYI